MAATRAQEIRVGIVTVVAILALVGGIIWGRGMAFGPDQRTLHFRMKDAGGVIQGTAVTLRGVRVGAVSAVRIVPDGVEADAVVAGENLDLRADAVGVIRAPELTGGKVIAVEPGRSDQRISGDATIPARPDADISALLGRADTLAVAVNSVVRRADTALASVNEVLGSKRFRDDLSMSLQNLRETSESARLLVSRNARTIDAAVGDLAALGRDLRSLVASTRPAVERSLIVVDTLSRDARVALRHLDLTLDRADTLLVSIDDVVRQARDGNGTIGVLLRDSVLPRRVDSLLQQIERVAADIERNGFRAKLKIGF